MKSNVKGLLIIVVLFLFTISGSAQTIGLKGGLNLSTISGFEDANNAITNAAIPGVSGIPGYSTGYAAGFHLGLMFQYDLPANFFLQPELLFSIQGIKEEATGSEAETSRLNFLQVPIYAGYDFGLVDQMDVDGWDTAKDILGLSSVQNRNIKISVGYFF
jgi:hypothetical protein